MSVAGGLEALICENDRLRTRLAALEAENERLREAMQAADDDEAYIDKLAGLSSEQLSALTAKHLGEDGETMVSLSDRLAAKAVELGMEKARRIGAEQRVAELERVVEAAKRLLRSECPEEGRIDTSPDPTCPRCTHGTTPDAINRGLCPLHGLVAALDGAEGRERL